jgi:hypothetical protein
LPISNSVFRERPHYFYRTYCGTLEKRAAWQLQASIDAALPYQDTTLWCNHATGGNWTDPTTRAGHERSLYTMSCVFTRFPFTTSSNS